MMWAVSATETAWLRIARDLCDQITRGDLEVGDAVPSRQQLRDRYGVAGATARRAVDHLRSRGVLEGQPGRAVVVKRLPAPDDLGPLPVAASDERLDRLEENLRELYRLLGQEYPEPK